MDDSQKMIKMQGPGCLLYKRDLKQAYRQIPIDPGDMRYLGFKWDNNIFIDCVAPMGLRTSALMCQRITSALVYIHAQNCYSCVNYVDDLAMMPFRI